MSRILALDLGQRRIGLALSDPGGSLAFPLGVIPRRGMEPDMAAIQSLVREEGVEGIVVGLPLTLKGDVGEEAQGTLAFREELARRVQIPVESWDERLSTVAAEKALIEAGLRREKRRLARDSVAAALILQAYLDRGRSRRNEGGAP